MALLYTLLTGDGNRVTRPLLWLGNVLRHPVTFLRTLWPVGWSRRTVIFLVMQTLDNAISFRARRGLFGGVSLTTEQDPEKPNPTFIEAGNRAAAWLAQQTGGYAQSMRARGLGQHPDHGAHPRRCGRSGATPRAAWWTATAACSATGISWSATARRCRPIRA